jgi:hypothetical protein
MYVRRFTAFPKAQFDFSLVTWIGSRMEELLTGGEQSLSGAYLLLTGAFRPKVNLFVCTLSRFPLLGSVDDLGSACVAWGRRADKGSDPLINAVF